MFICLKSSLISSNNMGLQRPAIRVTWTSYDRAEVHGSATVGKESALAEADNSALHGLA